MNLQSITSPQKVEGMIHENLYGLDHEEVWLIFLTTANTPIAKEMISMGTLNYTAIDNRTILRRVLLNNAAGFIIIHNHPSGNPQPSQQDIKMTEKLKKACELMDVKLIDHVIFTDNAFFSFSEDHIYYKERESIVKAVAEREQP